MFNLVRAEWQKTTGNKMLTSFTLWVYPVGTIAFVAVVGVLLNFIDADGPNPFVGGEWMGWFLGAWGIVLFFPLNVMARLPIIASMAVMFAGEYEWNTWKNIVPRTPRIWLILTKFLVIGLLVGLSLGMTSLLFGGGRLLVARMYDFEITPEFTSAALNDFLRSYVLEAALAFTMTLVLAGFTALAVMLTRSMVGGIMLGFGLSFLEGLSGLIFGLLGSLFENPDLINLYAYTPGYAVDNIRSWALHNQVYIPAANFTAEPTLSLSLIVLAIWIIALCGLNALIFERQDLVS